MDIIFTKEKMRFKYRTSALIINNNHILLQNIREYWTPPGGKVQMLEDSRTALKREIFEELSTDIEIEQSAIFIEQTYHSQKKSFHELGIYYFCHSKSLWNRGISIIGCENGEDMEYRWFPLNEIEKINLQPAVLKDKLLGENKIFEHIINHE
ncbi:NUDIX domain-containing protein [Macrococcoides bohemicum]|uniref:NUDIX domain-containing protein n=1 Tax=Macrococcoides bohemicum TaxID=1903056 RepID=A0AAJ4P761_9STAP|nr:NUDIX domain-containing protein [Macrococcus bohemicus]QYA41312.1 NUDIX domain-containing protein [Macrococcus bohemicus]